MNSHWFFLFIFIFALASLSQAQQTQWVDPNTLKQSPFQRDSLTSEQMTDVQQIQQELIEVDPSSLQEWVDDFRRDQDVDLEISIFKHIASVYVAVLKGHDVSLAYKKDVYKLLNTCSMSPRAEVLAHANLTILSEPEANAIMDQYYANGVQPSPLILERK